MPKHIEFHFDFGSPNAYLAHLVIQKMQTEKQFTVDYFPILLGGIFKATGNVSPLEQAKNVPNKAKYIKNELMRFVVRNGLQDKFNINPHFPMNTLYLMRGAIAASMISSDVYEKYVNVMFDAMWFRGLKIDDVDVISQLFIENNLPGKEILSLSQSDNVKQVLITNTEKSVDMGSFGAPTFFIDSEMFFGKETLALIEEIL